nr:bifunctional adenosylcobinamide kinase/adenosylcobinamide-phosphate guanylyltransferase [Cohnella sp. REN36]
MVTGGIGCGKSAYADSLAEDLGREAIRLACPAWPSDAQDRPPSGEPASFHSLEERGERGFLWSRYPADGGLASRLDRINRDSNPFRAERRVVLVDSLSGWLRQAVAEASRSEGGRERVGGSADIGQAERIGQRAEVKRSLVESAFREVLRAVFAFQGTRIIVTEDTLAGLAADPWERLYISLLCEANLRLSEQAHAIYRMTSGLAAEVRGERVKRRYRS